MSLTDTPWGYEKIWAESDKYIGKILFIRKDCKLSRQYYGTEEAAIYILEGNLLLELGEDDEILRYTLREGDSQDITPGLIYRFSAECGTDVKLVTVSAPEVSDAVVVEDDCGKT
jgi:mannose-6-phosphate isomerase-like protein (cupin superfamily)